MKIAFDASEIEFDVAGSGVYARTLLLYLATLPEPPDVDVISFADHVPRWFPRPLKVLFCDLVWTPWLLSRRVKRTGADLLHCPSYKAPPRCGVPVVATCHDVSPIDDSPPPSVGLWSRIQGRLFLRALASRADLVLTDSEFSRARIVALLGVAVSRVRVVPLGVRQVFSTPAGPAERQRVCDSHGLAEPYILFVGTVEERKNVTCLVRAFGALKRDKGVPHRLVLAGRLGRGSAATRRVVEQLGLRGMVRFLGYVPDEDLPGLYAEASLFVYPSLYEGFGLPPLEAMSQGTPVVVSDRGSLPEVVKDGALLFDAMDEDDLVSIMYKGLTDVGVRRELLARGSARVRRLTWEKTAKRTQDAYRYALEVAR